MPKSKARTLTITRKRGVIFLSRPSRLSIVLLSIATTSLILGILSLSVPIVPMIWYNLRPDTSSRLAAVLGQRIARNELVTTSAEPAYVYQPAYNESLPDQNIISIEKIGVRTPILEAPFEEYESALRLGVWRVPDFGTSFERQKPMILVAHRFGYLAWSNQYRRENSFFNLPDLEIGDRVQIDWGKRRYVYEIYRVDEGVEITDYAADLILYTCRFLESDIRIFRYARLLQV